MFNLTILSTDELVILACNCATDMLPLNTALHQASPTGSQTVVGNKLIGDCILSVLKLECRNTGCTLNQTRVEAKTVPIVM